MDYRTNSVDPDLMAHYEPPDLDLGCLQIQLYVSGFKCSVYFLLL